jgi:hypothetical protein
MTIMMAKLYDALRAGNVPDDKARRCRGGCGIRE